MTLLYVLIAVLGLLVLLLGSSVRVVKQYERGCGLPVRAGPRGVARARARLLMPVADRLQKVNMQIITMPVPAQEGITRDNVTVRVDAVVYFRVIDPVAGRGRCRRTTCSRSRRWRRPRCGRSSARATSTTCCPTGSGSTRGWS